MNPAPDVDLHHLVQIYDEPAELVTCVAPYLAVALRHGEAAVVVATPEHRALFAEALAERDVDVALARAEGRIVELDAAQTLASFSPDGQADPLLFGAHVGELVRDLRARFGHVSAYGEMVALLWAEGRAAEAVRLEELWNELGRQQQFRLYCAYASAVFDGGGTPQDVAGVFAAHTDVLCA